jgi:4-carboxymuconolactone decarboxylase
VLALSGRIVQHALAAGLPQDIVDGIAAGGTAALPLGLLRDVFDQDSCLAADPEALQAQAATKWGTDGLVEIVMVSGFYQMFAAINQGFNI